jgi:hypothetical protein
MNNNSNKMPLTTPGVNSEYSSSGRIVAEKQVLKDSNGKQMKAFQQMATNLGNHST